MIQSACAMTTRWRSTNDDQLASVDEPAQQHQQLLHVGEMHAGGRLIEDVDERRRARRLPTHPPQVQQAAHDLGTRQITTGLSLFHHKRAGIRKLTLQRASGPTDLKAGLDYLPLGLSRKRMNELLVGYARVSTEQQDLAAQRNGLGALGVGDDRIYVDHGLTGTNPGPPRRPISG
jgi:hypothetical protein